MERKSPPNPQRRAMWSAMVLALVVLALYYAMTLPRPGAPVPEIAYSRFKALVASGQVTKVQLAGDEVTGTLLSAVPLGEHNQPAKAFHTRLPSIGDNELLPLLQRKAVEIDVEKPQEEAGWKRALAASLPWIFLLGLYLWFVRRSTRNLMGGIGGGIGKFLESTAHKATHPDVTFADVAGQENAKREVSELVDYLRAAEKYSRMGAEVPRGVLLMGPPGTGKTLLARALAGEAHVPFYSISASEFIEVFVGVGAARVRHLFDTAKKDAPSIIFIDELDSIGRTRGTGLGGGHDEREQTLNQILAEMDGFEAHEAVIVLAATNRPDVLDPALLRPGRFDRHVVLDLPDRKDREAVLRIHTRKIPLAEDVRLDDLAGGTPGLSGADLKNLVNEAAMFAARANSEKVTMQYFEEARDKLLLGAVRSLVIQPDERHRLATHEAGHTLLAYHLPHSDPLYKVTIIPRGSSLGGTHQLPEKERYTLPEDYLRDRLCVILGGRAAEQEMLQTVSSGADDDIRQATRLARAMVARWGMSKEVGPMDLRESEEHPFLGREIAQPRHLSESSAQSVDNAVRKLLLEAEQRATETLHAHRPELESLVQALEEHETLHREQIEACLRQVHPEPQKQAL